MNDIEIHGVAKVVVIDEIAAMLDVGSGRIRRWVKNGQFPAPVYLPDDRAVWLVETIDEWIRKLPSERPKKKAELAKDSALPAGEVNP